MTLFWDRQNKPIENVIDWAKKYEDVAYRIIAVDMDGPDKPMVSTIWEGMDRSFAIPPTDDTALIFETAVVIDGRVIDAFLAHSEEGAREMHRMVCIEILNREPRPEDGHVQTIIEMEKGRK